MRPGARGSAVYGLTGDRISYRWPHILPVAAYPTGGHISYRLPQILPSAAYPTDRRISCRRPHILPAAAYPTGGPARRPQALPAFLFALKVDNFYLL